MSNLLVSVAWRGLDFEELGHSFPSGGVEFRQLKLGDGSPQSVERFRSALRGNLVILRLAGTDPRSTILWIKNLVGSVEWHQRRAEIVIRTQDSHVQSALEVSADSEVDFWALSHPAYTNHLPRQKVVVVPVGIEGLSRQRAFQIANEEWPSEDLDAMCMMNIYVGSERNYEAYLLSKELRRRGLKAFFGTIKPAIGDDAGTVYRSWRRAKVAINLPMRKDFNLRNFETALAGVPTITREVPGHEIFPELTLNTSFASHIGDTADKIMAVAAQSHKPFSRELPVLVAQRHLSNNRLYEIVEKITGVKIDLPDLAWDGESAVSLSRSSFPIEKVHSEVKLLLASPAKKIARSTEDIRGLPFSDFLLQAVSLPARAIFHLLSIIRKGVLSALLRIAFQLGVVSTAKSRTTSNPHSPLAREFGTRES